MPRCDLARRYARTHGPFTTAELAARYGLGRATAEALLKALAAAGRLLEGEFRPGGAGREWCDPERAAARCGADRWPSCGSEVEPVEPAVLGRLVDRVAGPGAPAHAGSTRCSTRSRTSRAAPMPASVLETRDPAGPRRAAIGPADLDALCAAGEVVWCGVEPLGERDGRVALYLTDHLPRLLSSAGDRLSCRPREARHRSDISEQHGASFFAALHEAAGGGYPGETVDALWDLVWKGVITNDTFHALTCVHATARTPVAQDGAAP